MPPCTNLCPSPPPAIWWSPAPAGQQIPYSLSVGSFTITGDFYAEIRDVTTGANPATVIPVTDTFAIDIHVDLTVPSPWQYLLCGYWCISVCLESLCGDTNYRFPQDLTSPPGGYCCELVPFDCTSPTPTTFDSTICVPGCVVQESECGSPYEVTVIVTLLSQCLKSGCTDSNDPGCHIPVGVAGSLVLGLVTFYQG
jgi:hypothetical protein